MTDKEFIDCQHHRNAILFKIVSRCNDSCIFCTEYDNIQTAKEDLSFEEIKKNYEFLRNRLSIDYVILSGGEPTLHPDIFNIIDYFKAQGVAFRIITNIIKLNDDNILLRYKKIFSSLKSEKQRRLSTLILSVNDLPERSLNARRRIEGLKKVMGANLPLMITVVVYKDNLEYLQEIAEMLKNTFIRSKFHKDLYIELRLAYIKDIEHSLSRNYAPDNFLRLRENIEKTLFVLDISGINLILWNLPFCYLDGSVKIKKISVKHRLRRRYIKINKDFQFDCAKVRNWESYLKYYNECSFCKFREDCGRIEKEYIEKLNFPRPKRI